MERFLALLAALALVGCVLSGHRALSQFSEANDLWGLLYCAIALTLGLFALRIFGTKGEDW